ncbi:S8/S53 family peptidase [Cyclobacterium sp.]|uniref:S8 family peptidase n=1 Tax=Cyclobacterium sp. TaxID=1966343 RepID=UPI00198FA5AE|nr:S8/S53 family peptidase [Cyclobacterium sp.]MBD3626578.1 S8/S53 family peptidase [Cyclobacterium sp.]
MKENISINLKIFGFRYHLVLILLVLLACEPGEKERAAINTDYVENQLLVMYREGVDRQKARISALILKEYPEAKKRGCSACNESVDLWEAEGIQDILLEGHIEVSQIGNVRTTGMTEDGSVFFSLNFLDAIPNEEKEKDGLPESEAVPDYADFRSEEKVTVAILDSGIETGAFPEQYLWKSSGNRCYRSEKYGWNFVGENADVTDDTAFLHGTLINAYVLEQFFKIKNNIPELLNVKVLDNNNEGNLFDLICGIFYAREKKAKVINTSLGFYDYDLFGQKHPYLDYLITDVLRKDSIVFVTAAGNETAFSNEMFVQLNLPGSPRDLNSHNFHLAVIGDTEDRALNNMVVVTTINDKLTQTSPRQNHASKHVDMGVVAERINGDSYQFSLPFITPQDPGDYIGGSSFASGIVAGKIGASINPRFYTLVATQNKKTWMSHLEVTNVFDIPDSPTGIEPQVKYGRYSKR